MTTIWSKRKSQDPFLKGSPRTPLIGRWSMGETVLKDYPLFSKLIDPRGGVPVIPITPQMIRPQGIHTNKDNVGPVVRMIENKISAHCARNSQNQKQNHHEFTDFLYS